MDIEIKSLEEVPKFHHQVAQIFHNEWGFHFSDEWNIHTLEEMIDDLLYFTHLTYVALLDGQLVGTVAIYDEDLKSHAHLRPWLTCLYVDEAYRGKGIAKRLVKFVLSKCDCVYLWCYTKQKRMMYARWGFDVIEEIKYRNEPAYVMKSIASEDINDITI